MKQNSVLRFGLSLFGQGFAELFMVVVKTFVLLFVLVFPVWFFGGGALDNWSDPVVFSLKSWLFVHNVDLHVAEIDLTVFALGFSFFPLWLAFRSGKRLGVAAKSVKVLWAWGGGTVFYMLFSVFLLFMLQETDVGLYFFSVMFVPTLWVFLAMVAGSFWVLFSQVDAKELDVKFLNMRKYFVELFVSNIFLVFLGIFRAVLLAILGVFVFSSVILGIVFASNWYRMVGVYQSLDSGFFGGIILLLGQIAYLPNLLVWVSGWLSGVGFLLGEATLVSPLVTVTGPLPLVPFFAAAPASGVGGVGMLLVVLLPVVSGLLAGNFLFRNYFDALQGFVDKYVVNLWLSNFCVATIFSFFVGFFCGFFMNVLAVFTRGTLGVGEFGVFSLQFGFLLGLEVAVGCFLALCLGLFGYDFAKFFRLR